MAVQVMRLPPDVQGRLSRELRACEASAPEQLWVPQILYATSGSIGAGEAGYFPQEAVSSVQDDLVNKSAGPMLVRALTTYFGSLRSGHGVKIGTKRSGEPVSYWHRPGVQVNDFMISNGQSFGETRAAAGTGEVFRLWKPYRFMRHETLVVRVGSSANGQAFDASMGECAHGFAGRGARSGKPYVLGYRVSSGDPYTWSHENVYDEDVLIDSLTLMGQGLFELAQVEPTMGQKWSRGERDWYLLGTSFPAGRHVFDYLPGGALVLEPGESIAAELSNADSQAWTFRLMVEAYVLREVPT
jgi:hypothetical protein